MVKVIKKIIIEIEETIQLKKSMDKPFFKKLEAIVKKVVKKHLKNHRVKTSVYGIYKN